MDFMYDTIIPAIAALYDGVVKGIKWGSCLAVTWLLFMPVVKNAPAWLKLVGIW